MGLVAQMLPQLAALKNFVARFDLVATGEDVLVDFAITAEQLERLLGMLGV